MTDEARSRIATLLSETADAHHDYEEDALGGQRDEQWARWYADRMLEQGLADVVAGAPTADELAALLEDATEAREREGASEEWSDYAAARIVERLGEPG